MRVSNRNLLSLAAWAGVIAPILFVGTFILEGSLRPGYNQLSSYVSALSLGVTGWIQIVNFLVFGALLFFFAWRGTGVFSNRKASKAGLTILVIIAAAYFFSGPFVMDPARTPQDQATFHGTVHGILGAIAFLLMPIVCFVYLGPFQSDPRWKPLYVWTLTLGIITAAADVVFSIASKSPDLYASTGPWYGLMQRSVIVPFMAWVFVFALALKREINHAQD